MSITFANPQLLWLLLIVPAVALYRFLPKLKKYHQGPFTFSRVSTFRETGRGWRVYLDGLPDLLLLAALTAGIVGLARPQGVEGKSVDIRGIDIYLSLDMSGSMRAIDMSKHELSQKLNAGEEPPNRFTSAVGVLKNFIQSREHDRIGMTVFAKRAFLQFPLTLDYNTILGMLDELELGDINVKGTALGNAIARSVAGLKESDTKTKILILITDGKRQGGNIAPMKAAEMAEKYDIKIFPILVGKEGPTLVPVQVQSLFGSDDTKYKRHEFPVNPELLKQIANKTDGTFYRAEDASRLKKHLHRILDQFERTRLRDKANVNRSELYRPFALLAFVLLLLQFGLRYTFLRRFP